MAKNKRHHNKSDIPADRQRQPKFTNRANKQTFGIGCPLTPESNQQFVKVMTNAKPELENHLARVRGAERVAELVVPEAFGVIFVVENRVGHARRLGLLQSGFALARMVENIERHSQGDVSRDIPIDGFGFYDKDRPRAMVARLASKDKDGVKVNGLQELMDAVPIVRKLLVLSKANGLEVSDPDNVSVFDYGLPRDKKGLSGGQEDQVSEIVGRHFEQAGIDSLSVGGLVIGNSIEYPWMAA